MKNLKGILVASGLVVIGIAIYRYYKKQIQFISNVDVQVVGVKIVTISETNISLDITNKLFNSSNVEATITEMYLDFLINGIKVGNVNEVKDILIMPAQTTNLTYRFSFNPKIVLGNIVNLVTLSVGTKDIKFDAVGYIKVKSSFLNTTVPFEYHNNLKKLLNK
jgi:LEA14-like dessication related protein